MNGFYRQKKGRAVSGVLIAIADKMGWDIRIVRAVFLIVVLFFRLLGVLALVAYILATIFLPYKEDVEAERFGTGPRRRKDAEKI